MRVGDFAEVGNLQPDVPTCTYCWPSIVPAPYVHRDGHSCCEECLRMDIKPTVPKFVLRRYRESRS